MSDETVAAPSSVWRQPMVARRVDEAERTSTPLELFFDLCFVVAVAQAAAALHHAVSEGHVADGVVGYLFVFFAVWWAWMNFTWFASAYDTDDVPYRLTTMVQIAGALVFAATVPRALDGRDFAVITLGYVIMRLAMVTQWLRAAKDDPVRRSGCLRFAAGVTPRADRLGGATGASRGLGHARLRGTRRGGAVRSDLGGAARAHHLASGAHR